MARWFSLQKEFPFLGVFCFFLILSSSSCSSLPAVWLSLLSSLVGQSGVESMSGLRPALCVRAEGPCPVGCSGLCQRLAAELTALVPWHHDSEPPHVGVQVFLHVCQGEEGCKVAVCDGSAFTSLGDGRDEGWEQEAHHSHLGVHEKWGEVWPTFTARIPFSDVQNPVCSRKGSTSVILLLFILTNFYHFYHRLRFFIVCSSCCQSNVTIKLPQKPMRKNILTFWTGTSFIFFFFLFTVFGWAEYFSSAKLSFDRLIGSSLWNTCSSIYYLK